MKLWILIDFGEKTIFYRKFYIVIFLHSLMKRNFSYIWIIRGAGKNRIRSNLEYKMIDEAPTDLIPLLEVINEQNLPYFHNKLKRKYGEVWVDLPYYLAEWSNKSQEDVENLKKKYISAPEKFFSNNKNYIGIPVVSAPLSDDFDFERKTYNLLKKKWSKIAVRVRVPTIDIGSEPRISSSFKNLINDMRNEDILLLDIFQFITIEAQIISNIDWMKDKTQKKAIKIYILNAFETNKENSHNYGPLLVKHFSVEGFGDFAAEERIKKGGMPSKTRKIRYYIPSDHTLRFFTAKKTTKYYLFKEGGSYWKRFKMLHYLWCVVNETAIQFSGAKTAEDLDPDGYDIMIKS